MNRMSRSTVLAAVCLVAAWGAVPARAAAPVRAAQQTVRTAAAIIDVPLDGGVYSATGGECVAFSGEAIVEVAVDVTQPSNSASAGVANVQATIHWAGLDGAGMRTGTEYGGLGVSQITVPLDAFASELRTSFRTTFNLVPVDILVPNHPSVGDVHVDALVQLTVRPSGVVVAEIRVPRNVCQPSPLLFPPVR